MRLLEVLEEAEAFALRGLLYTILSSILLEGPLENLFIVSHSCKMEHTTDAIVRVEHWAKALGAAGMMDTAL